MIWAKVIIFVSLSFLAIWMSNYSSRLHAELDYVSGPQPRKNPSRFLDAILIFFIMLGCAMFSFFISEDTVGITTGSMTGIIIVGIAWVGRFNINN